MPRNLRITEIPNKNKIMYHFQNICWLSIFSIKYKYTTKFDILKEIIYHRTPNQYIFLIFKQTQQLPNDKKKEPEFTSIQ